MTTTKTITTTMTTFDHNDDDDDYEDMSTFEDANGAELDECCCYHHGDSPPLVDEEDDGGMEEKEEEEEEAAVDEKCPPPPRDVVFLKRQRRLVRPQQQSSSDKNTTATTKNNDYDEKDVDDDNDDGDCWSVRLLNLPPEMMIQSTTASSSSASNPMLGSPVGGMRRVSSCYFSIASSCCHVHEMSNTNHHHHQHHDPIPSSSDSLSLLSGRTRNATDGRCENDNFLMDHDVLMNVLSYLDGRSLAKFSETARWPNYESFYFLELQLQRALLLGGNVRECRSRHRRGGGGEGDGGNDDERDENDGGSSGGSDVEDDDDNDGEDPSSHGGGVVGEGGGRRHRPRRGGSRTRKTMTSSSSSSSSSSIAPPIIPSFEGSIAGTGVVSRLAYLDVDAARDVVQAYLDSNASMRAMPLRHSLAYFRQLLLGQYQYHHHHHHHHHDQTATATTSTTTGMPHIPENISKGARNMALLFTLLGAAYRVHQGGCVDGAAGMGDALPQGIMSSDNMGAVLSDENVEAIKNLMIKVGLAGGFIKAGMKTMKEKKADMATMASSPSDTWAAEVVTAASARVDGADDDGMDADRQGGVGVDGGGAGLVVNHQPRDDVTLRTSEIADAASGSNHANYNGGDSNYSHGDERSSPYHGRQQGRSVSIGSLEDLSNRLPNPAAIASMLYNAFSNSVAVANNGSREAPSAAVSEEGDRTIPCNLGMKISAQEVGGAHPGDSPSPKRRHRSKRSHKTLRQCYDENHDQHESSQVAEDPMNDEQALELLPDACGHKERSPVDPSSGIFDAAQHVVDCNPTTPFFSLNSTESVSMSPPIDNDNVPTGCVGAYAHAVKTAAAEVTRLVKEERRANFEMLSPEEQHDLGVRFIDACTSDERLHIVKDILQVQRRMDVDRFFVGPDDTETCALHAAAFNGSEQVLKFLCGGIDERNPNLDCGLCDVNVKDANGWTAMHFAAGANSVTSVRVLADHGAKLTLEAGNGYTPFHWAERLSNTEVAVELERLGADNRFVGRWMFGGLAAPNGYNRRIPFVSFLANRYFAFGR